LINLRDLDIQIYEEEEGIFTKDKVCVLGEVFYNKNEGTYTINNPSVLGKSKEDIMKYLKQ